MLKSRRNLIGMLLLLPVAQGLIIFGAMAQTAVHPGPVRGVWTKTGSPYHLTGDVVILHGQHLRIEAGVRVLGSSQAALTVAGVITAAGTETERIVFTASDTAHGWHGIHFINADDGSNLIQCVINHARTLGVESEHSPPPPRSTAEEAIISGGGIFCLNSSPILDHCSVTNNTSWGRGGGLYCSQIKGPHIRNSVIAFNRSIHWGGGGVSVDSRNSALIEACRIEGNVSVKWTGGGLYVITSRILLRGDTIINNSSYGGGGLFLQDDSSRVEQCSVIGNSAKYGGGIECNERCVTTLAGNIVADNSADYGGGLALVEQSFVSVDHCEIVANHARITGGGIFTAEVGKPRISDCIIRDNTSDGNGGGITCLDVDPLFDNVSVTGNRAAGNGGGLHVEYASAAFRSVSIVGNAAHRGGGIYIKNCPSLEFSPDRLCNIHQNVGEEFGSDLFAITGPMISVVLDTFTVDSVRDVHAYPLEKLNLTHRYASLTQASADMYVSPEGDDSRSGLSSSAALRSLRMAVMKILADSLHPRTIRLTDGEYDGGIFSSPFAAAYLRHISVTGGLLADIDYSAEKITVRTPWWKSGWALALYAFLLIAGSYIAYFARVRNVRLQHEVQLRDFQSKHLAEVDRLKSRFFSNISHEFRTPLTLILGPADQAIEQTDDETVRQKLRLIKNNARKLFMLVNQLLDFSRLESGIMKLQVSREDIVRFLRRVVMAFESWAERKKITLEFKPETESAEGFFDADKVEKIINNLLSNAVKFTPEGGKIEVGVSGDAGPNVAAGNLAITVRDTGAGIGAEHLPHIFDRFYRADDTHSAEGTGIGLALARELVELHHGTITAESAPGRGSLFTVVLPMDASAYASDEIVATPPVRDEQEAVGVSEARMADEPAPARTPAGGRPTVLIVEDNADLRAYIREYLDAEHEVHEASDGKAGVQQSIDIVPDLIISDIMMPEMDGIELCRAVKQDERTSHIPVILLTARAGTESKIEGLETGADDYVTKPFDSKELLARVKNLIGQRQQLRKKFSSGVVLRPGEVAVTSLDDALLRRVMDAVEKHMGEEDFSVGDLARDSNLSSTHLTRKLEALTNLSPAEFIRYSRLERAQELLEKRAGSVAEIAYQVGFGSPSYFSACFRERFGRSPSDVSHPS